MGSKDTALRGREVPEVKRLLKTPHDNVSTITASVAR